MKEDCHCHWAATASIRVCVCVCVYVGGIGSGVVWRGGCGGDMLGLRPGSYGGVVSMESQTRRRHQMHVAGAP
jgi:hypothetical protein